MDPRRDRHRLAGIRRGATFLGNIGKKVGIIVADRFAFASILLSEMNSHTSTNMPSIAELVSAAKAGNRDAYAELVHRYQRAVITTAWSVLHDFHRAQDVAQDSFVLAYEELGTLRRPRAFGPWLLSIARREAMRCAKQVPVTVSIDSTPDVASPTADPGWHQDHDELVKSIGRLPEHEREVVVLYYLEGNTAREIGELTGRPVGTVTKQLSRAVRRLRRWMAKEPQ